jgi:sn-glycerol 3-phosphate transport system substrate-binding protein
MRTLFVSLILLAGLQAPAHAQQEIQLWHAMGGVLGNSLDILVQGFNESQKEYRVVGTHKGSYEDTMIAALAAHRIGTGPHIVQVSEIGTAHMMARRARTSRSGRCLPMPAFRSMQKPSSRR